MAASPKAPEQRSAENKLVVTRDQAVGIMMAQVRVPADRLPELRAMTLEWRREVKLLLESDLLSADQILQTHAFCRTLGLPLPVSAFEMRDRLGLALRPREEARPPTRASRAF